FRSPPIAGRSPDGAGQWSRGYPRRARQRADLCQDRPWPRRLPAQRFRHARGHERHGHGRRDRAPPPGPCRAVPAAPHAAAGAAAAAQGPALCRPLWSSRPRRRMDRGRWPGGPAMSPRGTLEIPVDTRNAQAQASDPASSIWVEANAGSGKTFVLTRRVLRLLLAGVRPQSILCLTYAKAAAAEMRSRVGQELAHWALADAEK